MAKIKACNVGKGKILMRADGLEFRPTALILKEDGTVDDKPSFCMVMEHPDAPINVVYGQFSLATLQEALSEFGMTIINP